MHREATNVANIPVKEASATQQARRPSRGRNQ